MSKILDTQHKSALMNAQMMRHLALVKRIEDGCEIDPVTGCHVWQGSHSGYGRGGGYGRMKFEGVTVAVHRMAYALSAGPIVGDSHVDHVCGNRLCCNPAHLELVSASENQKRKRKDRIRRDPVVMASVEGSPLDPIRDILEEFGSD